MGKKKLFYQTAWPITEWAYLEGLNGGVALTADS